MSKPLAEVRACNGEAHSNPHIDHCMVCIRHKWGKIFDCPECHRSLKIAGSKLSGSCDQHGRFQLP